MTCQQLTHIEQSAKAWMMGTNIIDLFALIMSMELFFFMEV